MKGIEKKYLLFLLCMIAVLFLIPLFGYAQTAGKIAQKSFPSVVMLVMEDAKGQPISLGSGFFVRERVVATNLHVIKGATRGYAKVVGQRTKYDIAGVVGIDSKRDLVLLSIPSAKAPSLSLRDKCQLAVGDKIYVIGNPQGLEGTFSQGIISSIRQIGSENLLQITAPISPGSSGGPVLNVQGKVIGVAVATFKGGQNLNFAIPASYLETLLSELKPVVPLSTKAITKQKKSILDDLGGRSVEGVTGEHLTWEYPVLQMGYYAFSFRNHLREPVKDIYCLAVFYDRSNNPIDVDVVRYRGVILAGLAKRVTSRVDGSVQKLTTKVEFRILDFRIVE